MFRQLRREFLAQGPPLPKLNPPKPNKYLNSRRNSASTTSETTEAAASHSSSTSERPPTTTGTDRSRPTSFSSADDALSSASSAAVPVSSEQSDSGCRMALSPDTHFMSDTVQQEELPRVHHAEVVSVRKEEETASLSEDSNSSAASNSESSDDEERSVSSRNIMINIKPMAEAGVASSTSTDGGSSDSNTEQVTPRLEAPPQKQNVWGATRQKLSASSLQQAAVPPLFDGDNDDEADFREQQHQLTEKYFPEPENFSYEQMQLYREEMRELPSSTPREGVDLPDPPTTAMEQDSPPMPELLPARGHFMPGRRP